MTDLP